MYVKDLTTFVVKSAMEIDHVMQVSIVDGLVSACTPTKKRTRRAHVSKETKHTESRFVAAVSSGRRCLTVYRLHFCAHSRWQVGLLSK